MADTLFPIGIPAGEGHGVEREPFKDGWAR